MCAMQRTQQRHSSAVNGLSVSIRRISNHKIVPVCTGLSIASSILEDSKVLKEVMYMVAEREWLTHSCTNTRLNGCYGEWFLYGSYVY